MAHELNFENDKASMMYVGDAPWHGLGTKLENAPRTADEAMKAASLDWEVGLKQIYAGEGGMYYNIPKRRAVVRLDKWGQEDCPIYGMVGSEYALLQNREAFAFFDPVVESGMASYETAGSLGEGERVWMLAAIGGSKSEMVIKGVDVVKKYLLLSNGHDGRTAVQVRFTPIRVVCQNTLSWALEDGPDFLKAYHDKQMHHRLEDAKGRIKVLLGYYDQVEKYYQAFANYEMTGNRLVQYVEGVFPDPKRKKRQTDRSFEEAKSKVSTLRFESSKLFEEGVGNDQAGIGGTLWAAYNGVTELVDHHLPQKNPWQRMGSICFGEGEKLKHRAFDQALSLMSEN